MTIAGTFVCSARRFLFVHYCCVCGSKSMFPKPFHALNVKIKTRKIETIHSFPFINTIFFKEIVKNFPWGGGVLGSAERPDIIFRIGIIAQQAHSR